ncbi:MAG: beta-ketoacyl-ACP synthase II [Anaerolineae bacterium]|nr:beta-ketoacyl-ACP synthase II [Anaerolineae bacterium]
MTGLSAPRVVITGMGAVTPAGHSVAASWESLIQGRSNVGPVTLFNTENFPIKIAAEVKDFEPEHYLSRKDAKRMARASHFAIAAAAQAVQDANLPYPFGDRLAERSGVMLGSSMGGFDKAEQGFKEYLRGINKVTPFSLAMSSPNLSTFHVCVILNAKGYTNTISTACSAGTVAIAEGAEVIKRGRCDIMLAGGTEANINETTMVGFVAMQALSTRNHDPQSASRPFDAHRDGFVLGEGSAFFVLERLEHALVRNARIYAEVLGSAHSSDTYHIIAPDPAGQGAIRAMRWAMEDAKIGLEDVDYINAHAASTPVGDKTETLAIKTLFGERAYEIPVNSTKSMLGHSFGATGAIEAMTCVKSIETGVIHPTINYETPEPDCDLDYVPNQARHHPVNIALSNSFGLGGQNSCLVLGKYR